AAVRDGCLQRVRYTGQQFYLPVNYSVKSNGVLLTFSQPLERSTAENTDSFAVQRWNYRWTSTYGSPDFSVSDPEKQGRDSMVIKAAKLSADGRDLLLEMADMRPAMQMKIQYNL